MKQPIIYFLFYFSRFSEVRKMKANHQRLLSGINSANFISESDKTTITELLHRLANPKSWYLVAPLNTSSKDIKLIRSVQDVIASYLPKAKNEKEYKLIEETLRASNDFFRYHEMFEQNVMWWMTWIVIVTIIVAPIITVFS